MNHFIGSEDGVAGVQGAPPVQAFPWPSSERRMPTGHEAARALDVLSARFRVIRRIVGEPSFRRVASRYIGSEPPQLPIPRSYGEGFPRFIRAQGNGGSFDYVADIAVLEFAVGRARDAHTGSVDRQTLPRLRGRRLADTRIALHPAVGLVQSRFPIVSIWESAQGERFGMIERWCPEAALVARPFRKVEIVRLSPAGYAFLHALRQGQRIATAAEIAATAGTFNLAASLTLIEKAGVTTGRPAAAKFSKANGVS